MRMMLIALFAALVVPSVPGTAADVVPSETGTPTAAVAGPAGLWRVQFMAPLGQRAVTMTINQSGATLKGHVTDEFGEYPMSGRFADGSVTAVWSVSEEGRMLEITMHGTLDGDEIRGTATLGDIGEGSLLARRVSDAGN